MSLSLTKLSMENKCGIYVLQNINKKLPSSTENILFSVFLVLLPLDASVFVFCVLLFKICCCLLMLSEVLLAELTKY